MSTLRHLLASWVRRVLSIQVFALEHRSHHRRRSDGRLYDAIRAVVVRRLTYDIARHIGSAVARVGECGGQPHSLRAIADGARWHRSAALRMKPSSVRAGRRLTRIRRLLECGLCASKLNHQGKRTAPVLCMRHISCRRSSCMQQYAHRTKGRDEAVEHAGKVMRELWSTRDSQSNEKTAPCTAELDREIAELDRLIACGVLSPSVGGAALDKAKRERTAFLKRSAMPRAAIPATDAFRELATPRS